MKPTSQLCRWNVNVDTPMYVKTKFSIKKLRSSNSCKNVKIVFFPQGRGGVFLRRNKDAVSRPLFWLRYSRPSNHYNVVHLNPHRWGPRWFLVLSSVIVAEKEHNTDAPVWSSLWTRLTGCCTYSAPDRFRRTAPPRYLQDTTTCALKMGKTIQLDPL